MSASAFFRRFVHKEPSKGRVYLGPLIILGLMTLPSLVEAAEIEPKLEAELALQVDEMFSEWDEPDSPGCAVGIVYGGELIYSKGFGSANLDHEAPNTPQTIFNTGSVTKSFTSACLAILLDQGKLSPDDDIRKFLPELQVFDPPIRVRHLIRCRGGIWPQWHIQQLAGWAAEPLEAPYQERDLLTLLSGQKTLPFEPGTEFQYGTGGYFLLGIIVKRVSGLSLAEFAERNLFKPLGMSRTFYTEEPQRIVKHRATGYYRNDRIRPTGDHWVQWSQQSSAPGGRGLYSSIEDLFRWDQGLYGGSLPDGKFTKEFLEHGTLLGNRNVLDNNPTGEYRGLKRIQFTGGMPGFAAAITRFPDQRFSVICLSNNGEINPSRITSQIADLFLAEQLAPKPVQDTESENLTTKRGKEVDPKELQEKVGAYRIRGDNRIWRIVIEDGQLSVIDQLNRSIPLLPLGHSRFQPQGGFFDENQRFVFNKNSPEEPYSLESTWPGRTLKTDRVAMVEPTASQLKEYAGEYRSDELATIYRIKAKDGELLLRVNNRGWEPLDPTIKDEFVPGIRQLHDNRIFTFSRNEAGKVVGLSVRLWRVRGVQFTKVN